MTEKYEADPRMFSFTTTTVNDTKPIKWDVEVMHYPTHETLDYSYLDGQKPSNIQYDKMHELVNRINKAREEI